MAIATIHQWGEGTRQGLHELRRVARGPVVIMTFDNTALRDFWITDYVPEFLLAERSRLQPIDCVCDELGGSCAVEVIQIPIDCTDGFMEAFYARPEMFLDASLRRAQSAWGFVGDEVEARAVAAAARRPRLGRVGSPVRLPARSTDVRGHAAAHHIGGWITCPPWHG